MAETDEAGFRQLVEQLPDVVARFDRELRMAYVNPAMEVMTGLPRRAFIGRTARELWLPASVTDEWDRAVGEVFASGRTLEWRFPYETPLSRRWFHCLAVPERDGDGSIRYVCLLTRDITQLKELEEKLEIEAQQDHLTGLATRRHFERMAGSAADGTTVGLCLVDLDDFKAVNDAHGHHIGDRVLATIAARLANVVRPQDLVARYGGDEFAVLVPDVTIEDMEHLATRIVAAFEDPITIDGWSSRITVSVGIVVGSGSVDELMQQADRALYAVKGSGKSGWTRSPAP